MQHKLHSPLVDPDVLLAAKLREDRRRRAEDEVRAKLRSKPRSKSVRTVAGGAVRPR